MPKSKREKQISLTRTQKKGLELKQDVMKKVHDAADKYARLFVVRVENMRNNKLKEVREEWHHSKFFFGKQKVMGFALGRSSEDEYKDNLHKVNACLKGQRGLLFTNSTKDEVLKWFDAYADVDFARTGCAVDEEIVLQEGPLEQFTHSMEPQLRQLGLPTKLDRGVVTLTKDFVVCKAGDVLKPEQARILKLLGRQMAEFKIHVTAVWSNDGTFEVLEEAGGGATNGDVGDDESDTENGD